MLSVSKTLDGSLDHIFQQAVELVVKFDRASPSLLQRRLGIGYARAARLIDQLEASGVIAASDGSSQPREVLIRSYDEFVANGGEIPKAEPENHFKVPENYIVPTELKLSSVKNSVWGRQLSEVIETDDFKKSEAEFSIVLGYGKDEKLNTTTLAETNNLIITGNPTSSKESLIDTVLITLLLRHTPSELRLILTDSGHYLDLYNGIPHLLSPVISDPDKMTSALIWTLREVDRRKQLFIQAGVRSFDAYQKLPNIDPLPRVLHICFCNWKDVETTDAMTFLTSAGLNAGIHLFIVTNRMSDNNLSADIKANIPNRAVFTVTSAKDSKLAGVKGAENIKQGEMLYRQGNSDPKKLTTIFTPEANVKEVVEAVKQAPPRF
jgi:DNA segregation ATPase FtsK/SpoIIIE-like protein